MKRSLLFVLTLLSACPVAWTQVSADVEQGLKPFGGYQQGNIDTVNLANGNVTIRIPLVSYAQRGGKLNLGFSVIANNKGWFVYNTGTNFNWRYQANPALPPGGPVKVTSPTEDHDLQILSKLLTVTDFSGSNYFMHTYSVLTPDGGSHEIVSTDGEGLLVNTGESIDASGFRFEKGTNTVVDASGVRTSISGGNSTLTDPNGNQITKTASGWTDTLGRVIPLLPGTSGSTTNCPTGTAVAYVWTVPAYNGGTATYKFCYANYNYQTSFGETGVIEAGGTTQLMNAIVLPNLTTWQFNYDAYANITSVTFPTGGSITYTYGNAVLVGDKSRVVTQRTLNANDGTGNHTTNYQWKITVGGQQYNLVTNPAGDDTLNQSCIIGYICTSKVYSGSYSTGTLLKTVTSQYHWETDPYEQYTGSTAITNVVLNSVTTTWPGGKTGQITYTYDPGFTYYMFQTSDDSTTSANGFYGKQTLQTFSDYGSGGTPGPVLRQNSTTYQWQSDSTYATQNLLDLVATSKVLDGSSHLCAETDSTYDNASYLTASGVTMQHVAAPGTKRGNVSSITQQLSSAPCQSGATWRGITSYVNAYDTGTTYQSIDPLNHTTTYTHSPTFYGALVTQTQLNNTTTPGSATIVQHVTSANYDFDTGLVTSSTNENGNVTSLQYDAYSRLTQTSYPDGGLLTFAYQDSAPFSVTVTRKINSTQNEITTATLDGIGRVSQTQFHDPDCTTGYVKQDFVHTEDTSLHDLLAKASTPYCNTPDSTYGLLSVTHSDTLNRTKSVVQTDGSTATTTYNDNQTTVTDEAGKKRTSQVDGLGRLTTVWEDPNSLNYETDYQYDTLGNLLRVDQKGTSPTDSSKWRTRTFTYDSLSRLLTSNNPERGTITYTYNDDGTIATRSAPKPNQSNPSTLVTTTYSYDEIKRTTSVSYSDGTTPTVRQIYDGVTTSLCSPPSLTPTNPKPRRTSMCDGTANGSAWSFDVMGRVLTDMRKTNGVSKTTTYTYNVNGSVATLTYPSGRMITYTYNSAARPISAVDTANSINYATVAKYAPQGALASFQNGASLISTYYFNKRMQPCRISVKNSGTAPSSCSDAVNIGNVLDFTYGFNLGTTDNGNVAQIANNRNSSRTQNFGYDSLNRLTSASTQATSGTYCWGEQFGYDAWANLNAISALSGYTGCTQESGMSATINQATNQISNTGFTYDSAGNTTSDATYSYSYDGENQMITAAGVTYTFDGEGRRVQKSSGTIYWYGSGSDALDESDASGNITNEYIFFGGARIARRDSSGNVTYYFADHLGSSRAVTNSSGTIQDDSDFYPFGGERVYSSSSGNHYKFERKERDTETGNDDFGARFYTSRFGRFLSVDWSSVPAPVPYANLANPQTLNLYSFVSDNPETFADLDGHATTNGPWQGVYAKWHEPDQFLPFFGDCQSCPSGLFAMANPELLTQSQLNALLPMQQQAQQTTQEQNQSMSLSKEGLEFIERHEGYSDKVYNDSAGNPTIGYGHLIKEGEDFSKGITKEKAGELLAQDTKTAVDAVNSKVTAKLSQTKFDALVDFTYNLGGGNLGKSTLLKNINAGEDVTKENFTDWNHAGGKVVNGLTIRRTDEFNLFSKGDYGAP